MDEISIFMAKGNTYPMSNSEEPRPPLAELISEVSKAYGINAFNHVQNDGFDIGTWWSEVASKTPEEAIQCWLERMPEDESLSVVNRLRTTLQEEIQTRQHVALESNQNWTGGSIR